MMIHKPIGPTVDINNTTSVVAMSTLISVLNTSTTNIVTITNNTTSFDIVVGPSERILIEKSSSDVLTITDSGSSVYATPVAYKS
jgi:hypothetical protein